MIRYVIPGSIGGSDVFDPLKVSGLVDLRSGSEPFERSEAVERLERLELTDPRDERSVAIERFELFERLSAS